MSGRKGERCEGRFHQPQKVRWRVSGDEIRGKQQAGPNTANCGVGKKE